MKPPQFSASILAVDPSRVASFYQAQFGLAVTLDLGWFITMRREGGDWELCVWDSAHESVPAGVTPGSSVVLAFATQDATADATRFEEAGVPIVEPLRDEPWGQRHLFVRDPAGTLIDVVEFTTPDPEWLKANGFADA